MRLSNARRDRLVYIQSMVVQLGKLATDEDQALTAYFLEMAAIELEDQLKERRHGLRPMEEAN